MTNAWNKVEQIDRRLTELTDEKYRALGRVLGMIDSLMLAEEHPTIFKMPEMLAKLREARAAYDRAVAAVIDFRMTTP